MIRFFGLFPLLACAQTTTSAPSPSPAEAKGDASAEAASSAQDPQPTRVNGSPSTSGGPEVETPAEPPNGESVFQIKKSTTARASGGVRPAKLKPTKTEAALRLFVIDQDDKPIEGVVVSLVDQDGEKYYAQETDAKGFAEALVPIGKKYEVVYLSLSKQPVSARVTVPDKSNYYLKLTLRYKSVPLEYLPGEGMLSRKFVLYGVEFESGKATLKPESHERLNTVVEYMAHKPKSRIMIIGHTDNVGNPRSNKRLSVERAESCRDYIASKGIDPGRIDAVGYGDEKPVASNDTKEGRQRNRRIEATEL